MQRCRREVCVTVTVEMGIEGSLRGVHRSPKAVVPLSLLQQHTQVVTQEQSCLLRPSCGIQAHRGSIIVGS